MKATGSPWGRQSVYHSAEHRLDRSDSAKRVDVTGWRERQAPRDQSAERLLTLSNVRAEQAAPIHQIPFDRAPQLAWIPIRPRASSRVERGAQFLATSFVNP